MLDDNSPEALDDQRFKLFADTADVKKLEELRDMNLLDGVTTNPSLVAAEVEEKKDFFEYMPFYEKIMRAVGTRIPVSIEVVADKALLMREQGLEAFRAIKTRLGSEYDPVIKLPMTQDGLKICRELNEAKPKIPVNMTLCFSVEQALLAARAGARFVSPFIGRLEDKGEDGVRLVAEIRELYERIDTDARILAASIRTVSHIGKVARAGAHAATVPPKILEAMVAHELTDAGLEKFQHDWSQRGTAPPP